MENVTRESVLADALRLFFEQKVFPRLGYSISMKYFPGNEHTEEMLRSMPFADAVSKECRCCLLGGVLYAYALRVPVHTDEVWPSGGVVVHAGLGARYELRTEDVNNVFFEMLEALFTRRQLVLLERAFEETAYSVYPLDGDEPLPLREYYEWKCAVDSWACGRNRHSLVQLTAVSSRYLQAIANAIRHGGTFDPEDQEMLDMPDLLELAGYAKGEVPLWLKLPESLSSRRRYACTSTRRCCRTRGI